MADLKYSEKPIWALREDSAYCQHGQACDVHCCYCHSGFIFGDVQHEEVCPYYDGNEVVTPNDGEINRKEVEMAEKEVCYESVYGEKFHRLHRSGKLMTKCNYTHVFDFAYPVATMSKNRLCKRCFPQTRGPNDVGDTTDKKKIEMDKYCSCCACLPTKGDNCIICGKPLYYPPLSDGSAK